MIAGLIVTHNENTGAPAPQGGRGVSDRPQLSATMAAPVANAVAVVAKENQPDQTITVTTAEPVSADAASATRLPEPSAPAGGNVVLRVKCLWFQGKQAVLFALWLSTGLFFIGVLDFLPVSGASRPNTLLPPQDDDVDEVTLYCLSGNCTQVCECSDHAEGLRDMPCDFRAISGRIRLGDIMLFVVHVGGFLVQFVGLLGVARRSISICRMYLLGQQAYVMSVILSVLARGVLSRYGEEKFHQALNLARAPFDEESKASCTDEYIVSGFGWESIFLVSGFLIWVAFMCILMELLKRWCLIIRHHRPFV